MVSGDPVTCIIIIVVVIVTRRLSLTYEENWTTGGSRCTLT
jgi:hypothetical protein